MAGKLRMRAPVALWMALIIAAPEPQMPSSPIPLLPRGLPLRIVFVQNTTSILPMSALTAT